MKIRISSLAAIAVLLLNSLAFSAGDTLVSLLPDTDAVALFEGKRFCDALPKLLAANPAILTKITTTVADIESKTGIDLKKFDQVAIGVNIKLGEGKNTQVDGVAIAGGDIKAGALVAMAKLASDGKYKEETVAGRSMFIITMPPSVKKAAPKSPTASKVGQAIDKHLDELPTDIAVSALDGNTLAVGGPEMVRAVLEGKTHANPELTSLLSQRETTIASFAVKTPGIITSMFPLDNDSLGQTISSIRILSGSIDVTAPGAALQIMARTTDAKRAAELKDLLDVAQMLGGSLLGSKQPNKNTHGRLIKNVKIGVNGNDVTLDLLVPQADIDVLVAQIK